MMRLLESRLAYMRDLDCRIAIIAGPHKAVNRRFAASSVGIAMPQRDLFPDQRGPLRVGIEKPRRPDAS